MKDIVKEEGNHLMALIVLGHVSKQKISILSIQHKILFYPYHNNFFQLQPIPLDTQQLCLIKIV